MKDVLRAAVLARRAVTARTVGVTLAGPGLIGLRPRPAQDVELLLRDETGEQVKRRYTIRRVRPDRGEWDLDVLVHATGGPGSRWAQAAPIGSAVELVGPRGKLELRRPGPDLFVGDEASLPAIAALTESLPVPARASVVVQVASAADQMPVAASRIRWLDRADRPAGTLELLLPAVGEALATTRFGHVYILTEAHASKAVRDLVLDAGYHRERVFAKGYWTSRPVSDTWRPA